MRHRLVVYEDVPRWYSLSWSTEDKAVVLSVRKEVLSHLSTLIQAPLVEMFLKEFSFETFSTGSSGKFGFNDVLDSVERGEEVVFVAKIPQLSIESKRACNVCDGSGKDYRDEKCFACKGNGKESDIDWKTAYALSASLNTLLLLAGHPEPATESKESQLLTVNLVTVRASHGGSLDGCYSTKVADWLRSQFALGRRNIHPMVEAMKSAHNQMYGDEDNMFHRFRASVDQEGGWLNVDCPGNACGLNPSSSAHAHKKSGKGYEFSCHNVDSPMQQLTLLAGLAALHDCVDQARP